MDHQSWCLHVVCRRDEYERRVPLCGVCGVGESVVGVWGVGVGTLLGPEEMTVGCFLGAACMGCSWLRMAGVVLVCCLRIV